MRLNMYRYFPSNGGEVKGTDIFKRGEQYRDKSSAQLVAGRARSNGFRARVIWDSEGYTVWVSKHKAAGRKQARLSR